MGNNEVAIVGGAGFVGSRLTTRFFKGNIFSNRYDIDLSNKLDRSIYLDVENVTSLDQLANASTIINLAAVHRDDVRPLTRYDDVNVQGAINVCEASRSMALIKLSSQVQLLSMDSLQRALMSLGRQIILMIMVGPNTWLNRFIRSGKLRSQKVGRL